MDLNVQPHLPATVFPERRLKSNLGDALMLVLPSFHRVPQVSALVRRAVAAAKLLHAAGCSRAGPGAPAARLGAAGIPWPPCFPAPPTPWPVAGKPGTPRRRPWPWWPWRGCAARVATVVL